jgi:hypothetical protein
MALSCTNAFTFPPVSASTICPLTATAIRSPEIANYAAQNAQ